MAAPVETEYGLREGAHVDLDGNLLRFGSRRGYQGCGVAYTEVPHHQLLIGVDIANLAAHCRSYTGIEHVRRNQESLVPLTEHAT